jgi:hypothetical protein
MDMKVWTRLNYPNMESTDGLFWCINTIFSCEKLRTSLKNLWLSIIQRGRWVNLLSDNLQLSKAEKNVSKLTEEISF